MESVVTNAVAGSVASASLPYMPVFLILFSMAKAEKPVEPLVVCQRNLRLAAACRLRRLFRSGTRVLARTDPTDHLKMERRDRQAFGDLVRGRPFGMVNNQDVNWTLLRYQLQAELLDRGENAGRHPESHKCLAGLA
jgi:hypothetical protein